MLPATSKCAENKLWLLEASSVRGTCFFTGDYPAGFCQGCGTGLWPIKTWTWFDLCHFQILFWYHLLFHFLKLISPGLSTLTSSAFAPASPPPPDAKHSAEKCKYCCLLCTQLGCKLILGRPNGGQCGITYGVKEARGRGCLLPSPSLA